MAELIDIGNGLYVLPEGVAAVKQSKLEDGSCTVFMKGQSVLDGFTVDRAAEEVVQELNFALSEDGE